MTLPRLRIRALAERFAHQNHCGLPQSGRLDLVGNVGDGPPENKLRGLRSPVHHHNRAVPAVCRCQFVHQRTDGGNGQVQHQSRTRRRKGRQALGIRHRGGAGLRPRQYDGLRDQRNGELATDARRCGGIGRHPRSDLPRHAGGVESSSLFRYGAVERRIARYQAYDPSAVVVRLDDASDDLVEVQVLGVDQFGCRRAALQDVRLEIATRVQDGVGRFEQPDRPDGQQIGGARPGPDELHRVARRRSPHPPRRPHPARRGHPGARRSHQDKAFHVDDVGVEAAQCRHGQRLLGSSDVTSDDDHGLGTTVLEQDVAGELDLVGPGPRGGVVDGQDEVGLGDGAQSSSRSPTTA